MVVYTLYDMIDVYTLYNISITGYYCVPALTIAGNAGTSKTPCPEGYYCPNGTGYDWKSCPAGTYNNVTGLSKDSECTPCPGGHYCQGKWPTLKPVTDRIWLTLTLIRQWDEKMEFILNFQMSSLTAWVKTIVELTPSYCFLLLDLV